jgi:hypothetical protein
MAEERGLQSLVSPRRRTVRGEEARMLEAQRKRREQLESLYNENVITPGQYGEAIYDAVKGMDTMDQIALATSFIPVVGDIAGGIADTRTLINDPSLTNLAFLLGGIFPFVPSGGVVRAGRGAYKEAAQKAATNLKNRVPNFYQKGAGQVQKGASFGMTVPEGLTNVLRARYDPKAKALQENYNISVADRKVARSALKITEEKTAELRSLDAQKRAMRKEGKVDTEEFKALEEKAKALRKEANTAGKVAVGQGNQTRAMTKQYYGPDTGLQGIHRHYDQVDHIKTFKTFNTDDYFKTVGDLIPSGTGREGVEEIFKQIKTLPAIGYNPKKNYQMNIRRAHTGSAGKLEKRPQARLFYSDKIGKEGRASLVDIKNSVFLRYPTEASKKKKLQGFNTDKEFLEALDKTGIKILNRDEVLKGKPAVITGDATTDAFEIGGANYMTAIDKRGKVTQIVNDEHDLLSRKIPKTNIEVGKLPGADRFMNVSEPIVLDLINPAKKTTNIQKKAKDKLKKQKDEAADAAIEQYLKIPGVDISGPLPAGFKSHEQWARVQAIAKIQPDHPDYSRLIKEATIGSPTRVVRASEDGEQENKRGGGSVIERNPYNYSPKAIL